MEAWSRASVEAHNQKIRENSKVKNAQVQVETVDSFTDFAGNKVYYIVPIPKPRMVKSDAWKKRPVVQKYWEYKDHVRRLGIVLPTNNFRMTFHIPMPDSWSKKKKDKMFNQPHMQRPDLDNLIKALKDSVLDEDCQIWDYRATKLWGVRGSITIGKI